MVGVLFVEALGLLTRFTTKLEMKTDLTPTMHSGFHFSLLGLIKDLELCCTSQSCSPVYLHPFGLKLPSIGSAPEKAHVAGVVL